MNNTILDGLTELQKKVCLIDNKPLLVLAGPGSGKTTVLTRKIAYILNQSRGERFKILALTFTNKAAQEMRFRVEEIVGEEIKRTFIGTFHAYCYDLLKAYGQHIGINHDFIIYDKDEDLITLLINAVRSRVDEERTGKSKQTVLLERFDSVSIIENVVPTFYYNYQKLKNRLIGPDDIRDDDNSYTEEFKIIFKIYQDALANTNVLDYSDIINNACRLLTEKKFVANQLRKIYKYILIDEGQDTNKAQFELLKIICGDSLDNLFIVADEDQLLYEWNDAKFEYLIELYNMYSMEIVQLNESFRCPQDILDIANRLIRHNKNRLPDKKQLISGKSHENTSMISLRDFDTQAEEADFVTSEIQNIYEENSTYENICVISRTKYVFQQIVERFNKNKIPYFIPMMQEKFSSREVNYLIDLLKMISNENDKVVAYNIAKYLEVNFDNILREAIAKTLFEVIYTRIEKQNSKMVDILKLFRINKNDFDSHLNDLLETFVDSFQYDEKEMEDINEDIKFIQDTYDKYKRENSASNNNFSDFMNYLALASKKEGKGVALLTGHASKGLEFDYVFLISLNQGIFPDFRAIKNNAGGLEEERRNCFVVITRTKKKLFLSYVHKKPNNVKIYPSQFLKEMGLI
ncbi:MAG: ATP-dependent helicase [Nitrospirae bacterium]|nr:ATP-dependent helicase [Nitrospirota bacterium]